jgi:phosphoribosylaminoimidazolesuccinocarboxamide synthase
MEKLEQLYEGDAKKIFKTADPEVLIVSYKEEPEQTDFDITYVVKNRMSNHLFKLFEKKGVPTYLISELNAVERAVKSAKEVALEVVVRNYATDDFAKKLGLKEGAKLKTPTLEFIYKNEELGNPFINGYYALAIDLVNNEEVDRIVSYAFKINETLINYFEGLGMDLKDFKIEFGRYKGDIVLADEISFDDCGLCYKETGEDFDIYEFISEFVGEDVTYEDLFKRLGIQ